MKNYSTIDIAFTSTHPSQVMKQMIDTMEKIDLSQEQYVMFLQGASFVYNYLNFLMKKDPSKENFTNFLMLEEILEGLIDLEKSSDNKQANEKSNTVMDTILSKHTGGSA